MKFTIAALSASTLIALSTAVSAQQAYTFEDVVHLTCEEVAAEIGNDADRLGAIVAPLAEYSLTKRGLTVPTDRPEIGQQFGDLLKAFCTAEPDSL
ncbi:MAG TPA: hypothetical protein VK855_07760, partial [Thioalkalivibrio sp.]|nr:hypothetical protein [Thioalkalivibrio sp.]